MSFLSRLTLKETSPDTFVIVLRFLYITTQACFSHFNELMLNLRFLRKGGRSIFLLQRCLAIINLTSGNTCVQVYLAGDNVIKILVEEGLETCLHSLGTEVYLYFWQLFFQLIYFSILIHSVWFDLLQLEFYNSLQKINSPLRNHIPNVLSSGILYIENGLCKVQCWDGKEVPEVIANYRPPVEHEQADYPFGLWSKRKFDYRKAGMSLAELESASSGSTIWPYVITERCKGKIYAQMLVKLIPATTCIIYWKYLHLFFEVQLLFFIFLFACRRDSISWEGTLNLASFLGEQMRSLHLVPCPALNDSTILETQQKPVPNANGKVKDDEDNICVPAEWNLFLKTLNRKKKDVCDRMTKW